MRFRNYLAIFSLILFALLLAGCVEPAPSEPAADAGNAAAEAAEPVEIEVFYPVAVDAPIAEILNGYVDEFEAANPGIVVEPVFSGGYGDVKTAIQTTVEGGGTPPALAVMLAADIYDLVNAGYIAPLDAFLAEAESGYLDDFWPAFMANSIYDQHVWGIPFQRSDVVLYYNVDLFAEAGIEAPNSWEAWGAAAEALTLREGDDVLRWGIEFPSGWPYWLFQPLAQFYIDLSEKYGAMPAGVQSIWGQAPTDFASGQTAMIVHSSGSLRGILEQADFQVGVMPLPGKEENRYASVPGGGNLYIMDGAGPAQKAAAWKFIHFLTEPDRVADYSIQTGYVASRETAFLSDAMQAYLDEVPQAAIPLSALEFAESEFSTQNLGEVRNIFHDYLQQAFNGEMSPEEAMAAAQIEADAALEAFR
jgi:sn-glycerol 3-phosphate transport system substrate-binding protein